MTALQPPLPTSPALTRAEVDDIPTGTAVFVKYRKYDGTRHWWHPAVFLGTDAHCAWVGARAGTLLLRPGREFLWPADWIVGFAHDSGYTLTVNAPYTSSDPTRTPTYQYVDITSIPQWYRTPTGLEVHMIDFDLDVVRLYNDAIQVLDEDEFADHQTKYGYPADAIATCTRDCADLTAAITERREPFGQVSADRLAAWVGSGRS